MLLSESESTTFRSKHVVVGQKKMWPVLSGLGRGYYLSGGVPVFQDLRCISNVGVVADHCVKSV